MIKNQRQYRITKAQAEKLGAALKAFVGKSTAGRTVDKRLIKAQAEAMNSQLQSLLDELHEYENLKTGRVRAPDLRYISFVPADLIRARIACHLSQKKLAEQLGIPEQQIQRYEAIEYESVSYARISEIAKILQAARRNSKPDRKSITL